MSEDISMDVDIEFVYPTLVAEVKPPTEKNAHLKGRKRFNADLDDMKEESVGGIIQHGFKVKSRFRGAGSGTGSTVKLTLPHQKYRRGMTRGRLRPPYVAIAASTLLPLTSLFPVSTEWCDPH